MVPSNSDIDMAPASPVMESTAESNAAKDKDSAVRSEQQEQKQEQKGAEGSTAGDKDVPQPEKDAPLSASEEKKEPAKSEGDNDDALKMDTDDGTDADANTRATPQPNGTSYSGQHASENPVEKKPRKHAERESKRGHKSSKANGHAAEEELEIDHHSRHPSDEKYRRLKRNSKGSEGT